jgi:hypothetical protein
MRIVNYGPDNVVNLPVSGGGSALVAGALLKRGLTGTQPYGHLRLATGSSAIPDTIGILREAHAAADDTLAAGTFFKTHPVQLVVPARIVRVEFSLASADLITCTAAVSTTAVTLTSLEDDIDTGWIYVAAGTGVGQLLYIAAAASGSCTLKTAPTTALDTTSKVVKVLPRFHQLGAISSDGTKLTSQAAAGAVAISVIDLYIERNNRQEQLNPVKHDALTGLSSLRDFHLYADVAIRDSLFYTID